MIEKERRSKREQRKAANFIDNYVSMSASKIAEIATTLLVMGIPVEVLHEAIDNANAEYIKQKPEFDRILSKKEGK